MNQRDGLGWVLVRKVEFSCGLYLPNLALYIVTFGAHKKDDHAEALCLFVVVRLAVCVSSPNTKIPSLVSLVSRVKTEAGAARASRGAPHTAVSAS